MRERFGSGEEVSETASSSSLVSKLGFERTKVTKRQRKRERDDESEERNKSVKVVNSFVFSIEFCLIYFCVSVIFLFL